MSINRIKTQFILTVESEMKEKHITIGNTGIRVK
jgi:hypothetical protein